MKTNWKETTLGEVLGEKGYIRGPFGSSLRRGELLTEGIPVYEQQNAIYDHREFRYYINKQKYDELSRFTVRENDLIISCSGTLGKISIIKHGDPIGIISQALLILRPDTSQILPKYLYYYFSSAEGFNSLVSRSSGSVQVNIAERKIIQGIELYLPSVPEQQAIINILGSLDDKIELLRRQNKTLEAIAQAIFKEWFVKFKVKGEQLKLNPKTGLPEGWRMGKLGEIADVSIGRTPPRKEAEWFSFNPKDWKWISIKDLGNADIYIVETTEYLTQEAVETFNVPIIPPNTVIVSFKLTVGRVAITAEKMLSNEAIAHIKLKNKSLSSEYIYLLLRNYNYDLLGSTSSIATAVNSQSIKQIEIIVPDEATNKRFNEFMEPVFKKAYNNNSQIQTLSKLRDTLLPKLMKGEIRVKL